MKIIKFRFLSTIFVLLLITATILTGCGADKLEPTPTPTTAPTTSAPSTTPAPTSAPAPTSTPAPEPTDWTPPPKAGFTANVFSAEDPQYGGVLRWVGISGPTGYDPHLRPAWAGTVIVQIYNQLVRQSIYYQNSVDLNIEGDLAESWTVSNDSLTYTFKLRQGVKWHDGEAFTADDVIYSFDKMQDVEAGSRVASTFSGVESYRKVDDFTVEMVLKAPSPSFLTTLAGAYNSILPEHLAGADNRNPDFLVGTGPFMFKEYVQDSYFETKRNPNYFREDWNGNQLPFLDGVKLYIMPGPGAGVDAFIAKNLDVINPMQLIYSMDQVEKIAAYAPEAVFEQSKSETAYFIYLNKEFAPFNDPKVLEAMGLIMDSEAQVIARWGDIEFGQPDRGIFSSTWGNDVSTVQKIMGWAGKTWDQRVTEAQKLISESGYPDGFTVRMVYAAVPGNHSELSFTVFGEDLKKYLNIDYELKPYPDNASAYQARSEGEWEMFNEVLYAYTADADAYAGFFTTGSRQNFMNYSNPEVDSLFAQVAVELDLAERQKITREIEEILLRDMVVMPGAFLTGNRYFYDYVHNFVGLQGIYNTENKFEYVWMEK